MPGNKKFIRRSREIIDSANERMIDARDKTREKIRDYPFAAVVIAAAVGAVVGVATSEIVRMIRKEEEESFLKKLRRIF